MVHMPSLEIWEWGLKIFGSALTLTTHVDHLLLYHPTTNMGGREGGTEGGREGRRVGWTREEGVSVRTCRWKKEVVVISINTPTYVHQVPFTTREGWKGHLLRHWRRKDINIGTADHTFAWYSCAIRHSMVDRRSSHALTLS